MKRPFDTINGEKVDFNNPEHVKIILERNKRLENLSSKHFELYNLKPKLTVNIEFECPACGYLIEKDNEIDPDDMEEPISEHFTGFSCKCCGVKIGKILFSDSYKLSVPKKQAVKISQS
ncbi:hypothetical protein [Aequorivita echinoideorum]|uniref:Uncharacterized protein n=1 Tax=Aequorivita echinoideorum TaxID=1549647 RepID=A0ABS5S325_9FLAO|nr:hypothetical protein [Aequorivita echinoideorum]MBT0607610.1 hypothetical protein [Aequorivita echinoideorum]